MLILILLGGLWATTDSSSYIPGGQSYSGMSVLKTTAWGEDLLTSSAPSTPLYFLDPESSLNVTGQLGAAVDLHCRVSRLPGDTTVSWLRRQDGQLRLLAVGLEIYSTDPRYSVRLSDPGDWSLRLRVLQEADQGQYECQVPSHPPRVHSIHLHVVVPELDITDERDVPIRDKFYNAGSTIQLKCRLTRVPRPSHFLHWRHGDKILNYDTTRGGISVRTDVTEDGAWSRLLLAHATPRDTGNYSCSLSDVATTSVTVHVLDGETPAAMQHGTSPQLSACWPQLMLLMTSWLLMLS
ncbi:zwei Ig domain protein zig-8-like [Macrosteles quadrilineatus]|uniref:zwei Ig domain protein zig-8-like n=1 Tax=Macrosteles quadrilineatus TaxID=74068 RepID=UPI0023E2D67E|nr:zwei Ig domain protein zig-8-like [Macrosteles quadrilineatus]